MKKIWKRIVLCAAVAGLFWSWGIIGDRQTLNRELIRLHVVANSDSAGDQAIKLRVRDAVVESLAADLAKVTDMDQAKAYIEKNLPKIQKTAIETLKALGCGDTAQVALQKEVFDTRYYDTFSLPAGVYEALRITIGQGQGKNWWCVVFPSLCVPATSEGFDDVAAGAGFPEELTAALLGERGYEVRFFFLDVLGRLEGYFFEG